MRDIAITMFVFGTLPYIFKRPWLGVLMWVWLSVMFPHRLSWGFAYDLPFAQCVAIVTLLSLVFAGQRWRFPWSTPMAFLLLFTIWMNVTSLFALVPEQIYDQWLKVMKIMFMVFVAAIALRERKHIEWLIWVIVVSLGFYGIKGGIFTIMGGGENRVYGPPSSYIEENNTLAIALLIIIPLIWYLRTYTTRQWMRWGLLGAAVLCAAAALGSYSRGALVTIIPMLGFLWLKSRNKAMLAIVIIATAPLLIGVMPERWTQRMETITNYEEDASASGRINAWQTAFNIAKDRPLVGGGFAIYEPKVFARYSPDAEDLHAAHSIYFSALGEHGWVGLTLFLCCGFASWRTASWIVKRARGRPELKREADLALMIQVSFLGYAVGGGLLSMLYYDVPYYLMVVLVLLKVHITEAEKAATTGTAKVNRLVTDAVPVVPVLPFNHGQRRAG